MYVAYTFSTVLTKPWLSIDQYINSWFGCLIYMEYPENFMQRKYSRVLFKNFCQSSRWAQRARTLRVKLSTPNHPSLVGNIRARRARVLKSWRTTRFWWIIMLTKCTDGSVSHKGLIESFHTRPQFYFCWKFFDCFTKQKNICILLHPQKNTFFVQRNHQLKIGVNHSGTFRQDEKKKKHKETVTVGWRKCSILKIRGKYDQKQVKSKS